MLTFDVVSRFQMFAIKLEDDEENGFAGGI